MDLAPGDIMSGMDLGDMTVEEVAELRATLGLDDPMIVRYGRYMFRLIQGDLGVADFTRVPVWDTFIERLPNTLVLAAGTIIVGVTISIPLGIFAARRAGKISDNLTTAFTMIGMSMPGFWLAALMILLFALVLRWLPPAGFNHGIRSVIMPSICAAMMLLASSTRQTRSSMLEILKADYLRTARAKGVPEQVVIRKHALGNALIPIVTTIGVSMGIAISGTAIIETVFAWPGIGRLVVESIASRDVTSTTGLVILTTVLYVLILLIVDIAYAFIDPRIKAQYTSGSVKRKNLRKSNIDKGIVESAPKLQLAEPVEAITVASDSEIITSQHVDTFANQDEAALAHESISTITPEQQEPETDFPTGGVYAYTAVKSAAYGEIDTYSDNAPKSAPLPESGATVSDGDKLLTRKYKKNSRGIQVLRHILRNPGATAGLVIIFLISMCFIVSLFMSFESMSAANVDYRFSPPSARFPFGTDNMGRSTFTRVIYAARFSLPIGVGATSLGALIGIFLGSMAAYKEGSIVEEVIMRFSDALASIPGILLGMVIISTLGRSLINLIIAIGITGIPIFIRITRASVLSIKGNEFVEAAKAIGFSEARVLYTQVLPNGLAPIIITFTGSLGAAILVSAGLSFLGFGIPLPNPEWGSLVAAGRDHIHTSPWLSTFPGLFIMMTVMGFNMLGDGLRDAFDPKLKR